MKEKSWFKCPQCLTQEIREHTKKTGQRCPYCGTEMEWTARSPVFSINYVDQTLGYYDNQLGAYIESSSHRRRVEKEKGVVGVSFSDKSWERDIAKNRKTPEQKLQEYKKIAQEAVYNHKTVKVTS